MAYRSPGGRGRRGGHGVELGRREVLGDVDAAVKVVAAVVVVVAAAGRDDSAHAVGYGVIHI